VKVKSPPESFNRRPLWKTRESPERPDNHANADESGRILRLSEQRPAERHNQDNPHARPDGVGGAIGIVRNVNEKR
jgi:hypothetical protein